MVKIISCASDFEPKETSLRFLFQVVSGTQLSLKITWFQAMLFSDGLYAVRVPLILPDYVVPLETELASIVKLTCSINTGTPHPVVVGQFNNTMKVGGSGSSFNHLSHLRVTALLHFLDHKLTSVEGFFLLSCNTDFHCQ